MAKKPTGLSITRSDRKLKITWKRGETYSAQQISHRYNSAGWSSAVTIAAGASTSSLTIPATYYPAGKTALKSVSFRIRGKKSGKWSAWSLKTFTLVTPAAPGITATPDDQEPNKCAFAITQVIKTNTAAIFTDLEWQSVLVDGCNTTDGAAVTWSAAAAGWQTGTRAAAGTVTITETQSAVATGTHTRWVRVRSRGPRGASAWRYARRVYAQPNAAIINEVTVTDLAPNVRQIYLRWEAARSVAYPYDHVIIEKAHVVPGAGLSFPAGGSWDTVSQYAATSAEDATSFTDSDALDLDECLFLRVNTKHVEKTTEGPAALAVIGTLKSPTLSNIVTNATTHALSCTVTHVSDVPDSCVAVTYRQSSAPDEELVVAVVEHTDTTATAQLPDWGDDTIEIGAFAFVGDYSQVDRDDGVDAYTVDAVMTSEADAWTGTLPQAPSGVTASPTGIAGTIRVTWDWSWQEADKAIVSWADRPDAWQSTDEPDEYEVDNTSESAVNISGLETGTRWYVRVRLAMQIGEDDVLSPWSEAVSVDLSSAPVIPALTLSAGVIMEGGSVGASWSYVSTDGTGQAVAEICEATITAQGITYGDIIARVQSAQSVTIYADDAGWTAGETHYLCVRVVSVSGRASDSWSSPVPVIIAAPLQAVIASTSLVSQSDGEGGTELALKSMPLTVTATGAGAGGTTTIIIERAEDYRIDRPDGEDITGWMGETVALESQTGEAAVTIERGDLLGTMDDGAWYRLICTVQDGLGQSSSAELEFVVDWTHQAIMPEASVVMVGTTARITPTAPEGAEEGDTCDIYRLSADKPELIVPGAEFGTTYVDPYPALGQYGGHRVVYKTVDGDYVTADKQLAWLDLRQADGDYLRTRGGLIDFDGEQVEIMYDVSGGTEWEKDFQQTRYLGGSIQGDWNVGVSMTASLDLSTITTVDADTIEAYRRLARYAGLCHIRTLDGASYPCDVQVSEDRDYAKDALRCKYSLTITRVDPEEYDGVTLAEYEGA